MQGQGLNQGRDIQLVPCYPGKYPWLCGENTKLVGHFPAQVPLCLGPWGQGQQLIWA